MYQAQFGKLSTIPLKIGMTYLIFTFVLFFVGPMNWQLRQWWSISLYVPLLFLILSTSFKLGMSGPAYYCELKWRNAVFLLGSISALVLLYPTAVQYTGKAPWQVFEALGDQRDAYSSLLEQLQRTQGQRGPIALIRSFMGPLTFAVLPLGIIYWKGLSKTKRLLLIATVGSTMILSVLRGTTRELADIIIVGGSALLVQIFRNTTQQSRFLQNLPKMAFAGVLVLGVLGALVGRTQARLEGVGIDTCIGGGYVCPVFDSGVYRLVPNAVTSVLATLTGYLSQGYYGLALALEYDFIPAWGLGHSPAVGSLYLYFSNDNSIFRSTYIERLSSDAWASDYQWSTAATWFASDVSFWGVPFVMAVIGMLWAKSWKDAVQGGNDHAAIFFCVVMMMVFYFTANNQMMSTFENYAITIFWGLSWAFSRQRGRFVVPQFAKRPS